MPLIILMRHAHAEMPSPGMRDFDRPLSSAGKKDATVTAKQLAATRVKISTAFCSPARRTIETLACVQDTLQINENTVVYSSELYSGDVAAYHHLLSQLGENEVCMIIGHNPMVENFAFDMAQTGDEVGLAKIKLGYPTAAIGVIGLADNFNPANAHGSLLHFFSPD